MKRIPIVIHGLAGVFPFISYGTKGIDKLIDALPPSQDSRDFLQSDWQSAWRYIQDCKRKHGAIEVILIGHSMGCYRAIQIAEKCRAARIDVAYIAAIDPTAINRLFGMKPMIVPQGVAYVDEFWASSGFPKAARDGDPTGRRGGRYIYSEDQDRKVFNVLAGHIPSASHPTVVSHIVTRVKGLLK